MCLRPCISKREMVLYMFCIPWTLNTGTHVALATSGLPSRHPSRSRDFSSSRSFVQPQTSLSLLTIIPTTTGTSIRPNYSSTPPPRTYPTSTVASSPVSSTARNATFALLRGRGSTRARRLRRCQVPHTQSRSKCACRHYRCHMGGFGHCPEHRCSFDVYVASNAGRQRCNFR